MRELPHERLESYRLGREASRLVGRILKSLPRRSALRDELIAHAATPVLALARATTAATRGDASWSYRVAARGVFELHRLLRQLRERDVGDRAATTAAIEITERLRDQLKTDMAVLRAGRKPWRS